MKRVALSVLLTSVLLSSCVMNTLVTIESDPQGAEVYLDHRLIGETPVTMRMSNGLWEDPMVLLRKEGYRDAVTSLKKEIKVPNLVIGLFVWPSLLWVYGPDAYQYYTLIEE